MPPLAEKINAAARHVRAAANRPQAPAAVQAAYYGATGTVPLISRRAFEAITGPKAEWWLVQSNAGMIAAVGASLGVAARRATITREFGLLGMSAAGSLAAIDVIYVARRRISPVYLVDAAVQSLVLALWLHAARGPRPA